MAKQSKKPARIPPGRKPKPIDYDRVEGLAARGMNKEQISACMGITSRTLNRREHDDPKLVAAIEKGAAAGIAAVTAMLLKNINLGKETSIIFYLKCRAQWKETTIIETHETPLIPDDACSPDEAEAAYIAAMQAKK